jgi:heme-degrading monooxygenase HmoA
MRSGAEYVIVWEFRVRQEKEQEFVEKYGPEGAWARFFRGSERYIRTELVHDVVDRSRFLTLDYWQTEADFDDFRKRNLAGYERLDQEFESLTENESRVGAFSRTLPLINADQADQKKFQS